jgi:hypothetical protein
MSKAKKEGNFNKIDDRTDIAPAAMADKGPDVRKKLDERGRAMRVLASQGRAPGMVDSLPEPYIKRLAALSDDYGTVQPAAPAEFQKILRELIDEHKAAVKGLEPNE